jgi:hypothetical protein
LVGALDSDSTLNAGSFFWSILVEFGFSSDELVVEEYVTAKRWMGRYKI